MPVYSSEEGFVKVEPVKPATVQYTYTLCTVNDTYGRENVIAAGRTIKEVVSAYQKLVTLNRGFTGVDYLELREWLNGSCTRFLSYINLLRVDAAELEELLEKRYGNDFYDKRS